LFPAAYVALVEASVEPEPEPEPEAEEEPPPPPPAAPETETELLPAEDEGIIAVALYECEGYSPQRMLSDLYLLAIAMTLRRITNCLSARVTRSLRSKLFRRIGGLVTTSMVMLGCSQVRVFAVLICRIRGYGRD
jgi:hypothetical protein